MNKEEVKAALKSGEIVNNSVWWFAMYDDGRIYGGCDNQDCGCEWDFDTFEEMWKEFAEDDWSKYSQ